MKNSSVAKILKVLRYSSNIWYLAEGMLGPLFAVFAQKIGGNVFDVAWAWALFLIIDGLLIVVVGKISDKYIKGNILMVAGYALNALFTFGYLFVHSTAELFFIQIGLGVASALATPTWDEFYAELEEGLGERYNAWGLVEGEKELLMGAGLLVGGVIISRLSFYALFMIMGIIQILATILATYCVIKSEVPLKTQI